MLFIEVHRVKEEMNHSKYQYKIGLTVSCTKRMTEATNGIGQEYIYFLIFDSWVSSKNLADSAMEVGAELVGIF